MSERLVLPKPEPDAGRFAAVIRGEVVPKRPPKLEFIIDGWILKTAFEELTGRPWADGGEESMRCCFETYRLLGYDVIQAYGGLDFPRKARETDDLFLRSAGRRAWSEEGFGAITNWDDFEQYTWPDVSKVDLSYQEFVAHNLPEGMGWTACGSSGFLEIVIHHLLGFEGLSYMLYDAPDLVKAVFDRVGETILAFYKRVVGLPNLVGIFQGDDMGYKTSTLIGVDHLRQYSLPWHRKLREFAHENGLLYILHSCGNLELITEDLISYVAIDARHSFEDVCNCVIDFKRKYGDRIAVVGGIDMHKLATCSPEQLRPYVRNMLEQCTPGGRFVIGTGSGVDSSVPYENFVAMTNEIHRFAS